MITDFTLAACAEMIFTELPIIERIRRIDDLGFQVEIWDWTRHDIDGLRSTGATFSSMTGYVTGDLIDPDGLTNCSRRPSSPSLWQRTLASLGSTCMALASTARVCPSSRLT
jgi:hydroxypyruvate isomerase